MVESTGAWYWLADPLAAPDVELVLAHATRLRLVEKVVSAQISIDRLLEKFNAGDVQSSTTSISSRRVAMPRRSSCSRSKSGRWSASSIPS